MASKQHLKMLELHQKAAGSSPVMVTFLLHLNFPSITPENELFNRIYFVSFFPGRIKDVNPDEGLIININCNT